MLGIARPYRIRGGERHDVGGGRMLTVRQIALQSGCEPSAIYARLHRGVTGVALLASRVTKLYDCGNGQKLTVKQIMQRTGLGEASVRSRISRGVTGRDLLRKERRDAAAPRSSTMVLAIRIADAYPDRLPTTKEIRALHPMSVGAAERWRRALQAARARA